MHETIEEFKIEAYSLKNLLTRFAHALLGDEKYKSKRIDRNKYFRDIKDIKNYVTIDELIDEEVRSASLGIVTFEYNEKEQGEAK